MPFIPEDPIGFVATTAFGAVVSAIVGGAIYSAKVIALNVRRRPPEPFFDEYNIRYFSSAGDGALVRGTCKITHGWLQRNVVNISLWDDERNRQEFEGTIERRDTIIYICATERKAKRERITITLKVPAGGEIKSCLGIMTGISVNDVPCATHVLLCRTRHWDKHLPKMLPHPTLITTDDPPQTEAEAAKLQLARNEPELKWPGLA